MLAEILSQQGNKPLDVIDTCDRGLQVAERLRQRYPDNEFFSFLLRDFEKMKQAAKLATGQGDAADSTNSDQ